MGATGTNPLEEGMSYVEKLDFREQEHRHAMELAAQHEAAETKRARYQKAESRHEVLTYVGIAICVAAVILGIVYAVYRGTTGPDNSGRIEQEREQACVEAGGGWVPEDLLSDTASHGLCVFAGK